MRVRVCRQQAARLSGCVLLGAYMLPVASSLICVQLRKRASEPDRERDRERERQHDKRVEAEEGNVPKDKLAKRETGEYTAMQAVEKQKVK